MHADRPAPGGSSRPLVSSREARLVAEAVKELNAKRPPGLQIAIERAEGDDFVLAFPHEDLPEGSCMDERFTEIQWMLHARDLDLGIQGGERDEETGLYRIRYKVIRWD